MADMSRRSFLRTGTAAALGLSLNPEKVVAKERLNKISPSDRLDILAVGVGGRGLSDLRELSSQNIAGLCDVDWKYAKPAFDAFPKAKRYNDYRRMFDEMLPKCDAVLVATPNHTHAAIAAAAIVAGKHVYCETPLAHSVYEVRLLSRLARRYGVASQLGVQGASRAGVRQICSWIWNGEIGKVTRVEAFTDRPTWPQGMEKPVKVDMIPATLNWDGFIGPAGMRPYSASYTPWNFRGWFDFGSGAFGDMGPHILQPVFKALKLSAPVFVEAVSTPLTEDSYPLAQRIRMVFPGRDNLPRVEMPQVELIWHDGGLKPFRPEGMEEGRNLLNDGGGVIFYGSKDTLVCGAYGERPYLLSGRIPETTEVLPVVNESHQLDWVRACKEYAEYRTPAASSFEETEALNETIALGTVASRLQYLNVELVWDSSSMRFLNISEGEEMVVEEMIKHNYREGWTLPSMPEDI